jgi:hypothetical protein
MEGRLGGGWWAARVTDNGPSPGEKPEMSGCRGGHQMLLLRGY